MIYEASDDAEFTDHEVRHHFDVATSIGLAARGCRPSMAGPGPDIAAQIVACDWPGRKEPDPDLVTTFHSSLYGAE